MGHTRFTDLERKKKMFLTTKNDTFFIVNAHTHTFSTTKTTTRSVVADFFRFFLNNKNVGGRNVCVCAK